MDIFNSEPRKIKCIRNDDDVWGGGETVAEDSGEG